MKKFNVTGVCVPEEQKAVQLLLDEKNTLFDDISKNLEIVKVYTNLYMMC